MSTRANIIIRDDYESLVFYRHSDGYPEGTLPALNLFLDWIKSDKIRDNVSQSAGWLIIIGAIEYGTIPEFKKKESYPGSANFHGGLSSIKKDKDNGSTWKCGAFEPTFGIHGDIEYLYVIDLEKKKIKTYSNREDFKKVGKKLLGQIEY